MEPDPREPTGDLGYDTAHEDVAHEDTARHDPARHDPAHEATGGRPRSSGEAPHPPPDGRRDDGAGDYGYDEAHDFRR